MKILFIGDIVGNPGRKAVKEYIPVIRKQFAPDIILANAENVAAGSGITPTLAQELYSCGIDALTMGNHTWSRKEVLNFIDTDPKIVRPANFSKNVPGKGSIVISVKDQAGRDASGKEMPGGDVKVAILNLIGRVYMEPAECPFMKADEEIALLKQKTRIVIVDMHAEATSEKCALANYLDGRVSCVLGTHTHVQTSDERILERGTAFISDVGMTGPHDSIIGVEKESVINKFITQMPVKFEVASGPVQFNSVLIDIDINTGKSTKIERHNHIFEIL